MRKMYITPNMEVVKVATQQMLATSGSLGVNNTELTGTASGAGRGDDGDDW